MNKRSKVIPVNRVEGDLEIHLQIEDTVVTEARSVGTMFRGFENILIGRAPLDSLVITPRICGICSTAHLHAAAKALDMALNVRVPGNAKRVRNTTLMVEQLQNDMRHSYLIFMPDLMRPTYSKNPFYSEAAKRYTPLKGETTVQCIRETKKVVEIIAILGGQWPHSSFMVPGGVVSRPSVNDTNQCRSLLAGFQRWYENRIIGCRVERLQEIRTAAELDAWIQEKPNHRESDLGFFIRFARRIGLDRIGAGCGNFISFGSLDMPENTEAVPMGAGNTFFPAGFVSGEDLQSFDQVNITEDISHSCFEGYDGGRHPLDGQTIPVAPDPDGQKYSWAKAPRYNGRPAETGPLAELAVAGHPLISDFLAHQGPSVFLRQLARLIRPALIVPALGCWLREIAAGSEDFYRHYSPVENGTGFGLMEAHRGALGHWVQIVDEKIDQYQIITPTAWNASPRDAHSRRGPMEEALVGTPINGVNHMPAVEHVIRSFDPCLVCTVHAVDLRSGVSSEGTGLRRLTPSSQL